MKAFLFSIGLLTGLLGLSAGAEAATHVLGAKKQTLSPSTDTVNAGYYSSSLLSAVDMNLAAGNIKGGVTIFGKLGTYTSTTSYALPDTGQSVSYAATFDDDANIVSGAQPGYSSATISGDAVTVDNRTGLMWAQDGTGAGCNNGSSATWETAGLFCQNLTFATYTDWRLPNIMELASIVDYQNFSPAINTTYFPNTASNYYWSSTTYVPSTTLAMGVYFDPGIVYGTTKTNGTYVRCVRAGP